QCSVEYVITVVALKEGWDCSFAYVFCSVARIRDSDYVEQLLGRVLRMPYARRRAAPELNRAYAHISEPTFQAAAMAICDKLVSMGFDEDEARENIEPAQTSLGEDGGLFGRRVRPKPTFKHPITATPEEVSALREQGIPLREMEGGKAEIAVVGALGPELETRIASAIPESERKGFEEAVRQYRFETKDVLSPAEQGETFTVPRLMAEIQGELQFADTDMLMEYHDWSLLEHPFRPDEREFDVRETARSFEIDLDGNRITYHFASEEEQLALDIDVEGWTEENLVIWLDRQVRQPDIPQTVLLRWLRDLVGYLTGPRKLPIAALMRCKFILARKLRDKIDTFRKEERSKAYQRYLFDPEAQVEVSFNPGFEFKDGMYEGQHRHKYGGRFRFNKHFLGADNVPAIDGAEEGEEFQCAQAIESLAEVKYWVRNVSQHPNSFWLPTSTDKFYPDFVALLNDGRLLVVEYKGAQFATGSDTDEKRTIGRLWEQQSDGKGLFLMVEKQVDGKDMRAQLMDKVAG
ncbi:MAG TPA: hypothetical protein VGA56_08390, partial [Opitutaceae bacterium]